jgi:hypothetical protein
MLGENSDDERPQAGIAFGRPSSALIDLQAGSEYDKLP